MKEELASMSLKELDQIKVFENLRQEFITQQQAAEALKLSLRQVQRKIKKFVSLGSQSLAHKSRGKPSNRSLNAIITVEAVKLIKAHYADFGPTLAGEMLEERHDIKIHHETLRLLMIKQGIWQRKARKIKSRRWRKRKSCYGALIQLDGSRHDWFEGRRAWCTLLVFIDDATSEIVWLEFAESESHAAVMRATKNYLLKYGRPVSLYTDYGGVFSVNLKSRAH